MEGLPGDPRASSRLVVDQVRAVAGGPATVYPRSWMPQGTFDELVEGYDRHPIHLHPAIHHLHHHWDMGPARRNEGGGKGPKAIMRRLFGRLMSASLDRYFTEEQEYRVALAQSIDAIAYRVDEISSADERAIVEIMRRDLLDLARSLEASIDERCGEA